MKKLGFYIAAALLAMVMLTLPTACTSDSEDAAEDLARRLCDCYKEPDLEKRESCIDRVVEQVSFHANDPEFIAAYNRETQRVCAR